MPWRIAKACMGAFALYLLASCAYVVIRPDLLWDPIDRQIKLASSYPVSLVPQNFAIGGQRKAAEKRLTADGYALVNTLNALIPLGPGGSPYSSSDDLPGSFSDLSLAQKVAKPGKTFMYWKDGPTIFPCGSTYDVFIGIGPDDLLQFAQARVSPVCL